MMQSNHFRNRSAFTMIEVLAVIAIIGTLAALVVGGAGRAGAARLKARVGSELLKLDTQIESYKSDVGFYPPDNTNNAALPPLYYELSGTRLSGNEYTPLGGGNDQAITKSAVENVFHLNGFVNSDTETVKSYFPNLKAVQHSAISNAAENVRVLILPVDGPATPTILSKDNPPKLLNTWRYVSTKPTNNAASFDLWADIIVRGETNTIGNWKD